MKGDEVVAKSEAQKKSLTDDGTPVVCACFGLTEKGIKDYFSDPSSTLDGLVRDTGVGTKCTACLLDVDLILDQHFKLHIDPGAVFKATEGQVITRPAQHGFSQLMDERESGFFIQNDEISTVLTFVNYSELFEGSDTLTTFEYRLRLYANDGTKAIDVTGEVLPEKDAVIRFSEFENCPKEGWFLLSLKARGEGMYGSLRPQFMLVGKNFSATVHTQPHFSACTQKSIMLLPDDTGFHSTISVLNPQTQTVSVTLTVRGIDGQKRDGKSMTLPALGSTLVNLDEMFFQQPAGEPCYVQVSSDKPVRKHIINHLSDGRWSIDHFPNFK
jgi:bacterioferritin-associated ferredoxin